MKQLSETAHVDPSFYTNLCVKTSESSLSTKAEKPCLFPYRINVSMETIVPVKLYYLKEIVMPTLFSGILLVYLVSGSPLHVRVVDKFSSFENCSGVIQAVERGESNSPTEERVSSRLKCLILSYPKDDDDDGPSKPVAPVKAVPQYGEARPCRHPIYNSEVKCKEAAITTQ